MKAHYSTKTNEWETPSKIFDKLSGMFGPFTLDPCATSENFKCELFFTQADDGLSQSWQGHNVFMNPPYGRVIHKWIKKAYQESLQGATVTCLIPARTDTSYWHDYVMKSSEVYLLRGRVRFVGGNSAAPFPSCVVIFRHRNKTRPVFSSLDLRRCAAQHC